VLKIREGFNRFKRYRVGTLAFLGYLFVLALFTFFPRATAPDGQPSRLTQFLQQHVTFFYRILYASEGAAKIGNYFLLTPFVIVAYWAWPKARLIWIFLIGVLISETIEISQIFIPGRTCDWRDLLANTISLLIGVGAIKLWVYSQNPHA
jgi:hypothetical protein